MYGIFAAQLLPQWMQVVIGEKSRISQRVIITRTNEVEAAGGLLGSGLSVSYANRIEPYTVQ